MYKLGYKSHDLFFFSSAFIGGKFILKNPFHDLLSSLNAVISTIESTQFITGHVIYDSA